jgi:hypothetical protein
MTKQEIFDALSTKFDIVTPINEWSSKPWTLGLSRIDIQVYKSGNAPMTITLAEDGNGDVSFSGNDPTVSPEIVVTFREKVLSEIESKKSSGTMLDAFIDNDLMGNSVCEVVAYIDGATVTRKRFVVWDKGTSLGFKEVA